MKDKSRLIIESIRNGENQDALKYLYKDPLNKIRKFILTNSGTLEDADDVFQDTVIKLFYHVKKGMYKEEYDLDGFLFSVAKNSWINLMRKKYKLLKEEHIDLEISDEKSQLDAMIEDERLSTFHSLFDKLEDNCKKILSYVIFEKKTMKEISSMMGFKDEKVAKNQHYRCKKYFSKILMQDKEAINILKN